MKAGSDRTKLEKSVMAQRQTFRSEKRRLLSRIAHVVPTKNAANWLTRIQTAVEIRCQPATSIDLVVDANAVAYNSSDVKDITADVLKQVK